MSESITQKLLSVQEKLKAPKGQWNNFSSFYYRSAEDILEAVKPLNAANGLLLTLTDEPVFVGDWHYIKATATVTDGENTLSVNAFARESENKKGMDHSQVTGTASSYARKYALNGLYLIDDTKDADTDEYQKQSKQDETDQLNKEITNLFSKALQKCGDKETLYKQLNKTKDDMSKLYNSKNTKEKKAIIKQLEGIANDNGNEQ